MACAGFSLLALLSKNLTRNEPHDKLHGFYHITRHMIECCIYSRNALNPSAKPAYLHSLLSPQARKVHTSRTGEGNEKGLSRNWAVCFFLLVTGRIIRLRFILVSITQGYSLPWCFLRVTNVGVVLVKSSASKVIFQRNPRLVVLVQSSK